MCVLINDSPVFSAALVCFVNGYTSHIIEAYLLSIEDWDSWIKNVEGKFFIFRMNVCGCYGVDALYIWRLLDGFRKTLKNSLVNGGNLVKSH